MLDHIIGPGEPFNKLATDSGMCMRVMETITMIMADGDDDSFWMEGFHELLRDE